jgi:hypothetical protein
MRLLPRFSLLRASIISVILFFAFVSARAQTTAQLPSDWTNALGSLADKIAAVTKRGESLSLEVKNMSSLSPADVDGLHDVLVTDLTRRNRRITKESPADATLQVTFSESANGYVWVAEIPDGVKENVVMVSVTAPNQKASRREAPITLHRKLIWEQEARIVDFGILAEDSTGEASVLIILDAGKLSFYRSQDKDWKLAREIAIEHPRPPQRNIRGRIDLQAGEAQLPDAECSGDFRHPESVICTTMTPPADPEIPRQAIAVQGRNVEDYAVLAPVCDDSPLTLVTGQGDWTEPDSIQAYVGKDPENSASSKIQFLGPVLELRRNADGKSARVVSRNLQTGTYEASIVSVSCGD